MAQLNNLTPYQLWNIAGAPTVPSYYWDTYSQEQVLKEICIRLRKVICYIDHITDTINDIINEQNLHDDRIAELEEWRVNVVDPFITNINIQFQLLQDQIDDLKTDKQNRNLRTNANNIATQNTIGDSMDSGHTYGEDEAWDDTSDTLHPNMKQIEARFTVAEIAFQAMVDLVDNKISTVATSTDRAPAKSEVEQMILQLSGNCVYPNIGMTDLWGGTGYDMTSVLAQITAGPWFVNHATYTPVDQDRAIGIITSGTTSGASETWMFTRQSGSWAPYYQIDAAFTPAQIQALESTITLAKVQQYDSDSAFIAGIKNMYVMYAINTTSTPSGGTVGFLRNKVDGTTYASSNLSLVSTDTNTLQIQAQQTGQDATFSFTVPQTQGEKSKIIDENNAEWASSLSNNLRTHLAPTVNSLQNGLMTPTMLSRLYGAAQDVFEGIATTYASFFPGTETTTTLDTTSGRDLPTTLSLGTTNIGAGNQLDFSFAQSGNAIRVNVQNQKSYEQRFVLSVISTLNINKSNTTMGRYGFGYNMTKSNITSLNTNGSGQSNQITATNQSNVGGRQCENVYCIIPANSSGYIDIVSRIRRNEGGSATDTATAPLQLYVGV